jgi:hypothetical protein
VRECADRFRRARAFERFAHLILTADYMDDADTEGSGFRVSRLSEGIF